MQSVATLLLAARAAAFSGAKPTKPNMVWFLTDDQDQELGASFPNKGGVTPMPKTKKLMEEQGATALNWYIHTPICSPSRSELLSGRYLHNIKAAGSSACHGPCTSAIPGRYRGRPQPFSHLIPQNPLCAKH